MFSYFAYGLGIHSTLPLPAFLPAEMGGDVLVRLEREACPSLESSDRQLPLKRPPEEITLSLERVGIFRVRNGCEIIVTPAPDVEECLIQSYIAEVVMAILLYQRGLLILHASAVEMDGSAIIFLGAPGQGKSSIAAALHVRGHGIVADDVTAVDVGLDSDTVLPGFPQLKLSPEVAAALGYDMESLLVIHSLEAKRAYRNVHVFPRTPLALKGMYVYALTEGNSPEIVPLRPQEALIELVRHSYGARSLQQAGESASHFFQCAGLAQNVPAYCLNRSSCLSLLPPLAQLVEAHYIRHLQPA